MSFAVIIIKRLMRLYRYNLSWWIQSLLCYLLLIIITRLSLANDVIPIYVVQTILITTAIFASSINPFQELYHDFNSGHLQQFMMLGIWHIIPGAVYLVAKLILMNICFILVQPITFILLSIPQENYTQLFFATSIAVSYNLIITFFISCLSIDKQNNILLCLLSLPLVIPGLLLSIAGIEQPNYHWLGLAIILSMSPLVIWMVGKILLSALSEV